MVGRVCLVGVALTLCLSGCGSPKPADLVKQSLGQWEEAAEILEGITNEESLDEASAKLEAIAKKMIALNKQAAAQELDPEQKRKLETDHRQETKQVLNRFNEAARKVRGIPGGEAVLARFRTMAASTR